MDRRSLAVISRISVTPVKGFRLDHPESIMLDRDGAVGNRRFWLLDGDRKRLRSSLTPWPVQISARWLADEERLWMRFPDGGEVEGSALGSGEPFVLDFHGREVWAQIVAGAWTERLSALAGHPVLLARPRRPGIGMTEPVTFLSDASVARLAVEADRPIDSRRFRMLFELSGCEPHEEDAWAGRRFRIGDAVVELGGPVPRCAVTTRDPDTGTRDLDTLALIRGYRGVRDGEAIDFGAYARVERPGRVRVGDVLRDAA
ncbi:MAG TPA: MOSC domain-containing protein [Gaiellaceae bacterium]|nr:MOSC domain-containing protein [Gaiellaceae bacterium]